MDFGLWLFVWLLLSAGVGFIAEGRGRSGPGFFLLAVVTSPLIGIIVVLVTKDLKLERAEEERRKLDHEREIESIRAIAAAAAAPAAPPAPERRDGVPPTNVGVADELTKLAALRETGVLTQDEFDTQKRRLLGL
ncbi:SHOCT domain-containing protein [Aquincola tertiaricarbonis]|uniref:SHOCT domain-containing protein n=1 Tax=Aquincola tertiaricarbonis TaxID=391953 RepID=UPI000615076E|nr:SHOCT domain-containing protein [Aquincola tertiaricarbonis]